MLLYVSSANIEQTVKILGKTVADITTSDNQKESMKQLCGYDLTFYIAVELPRKCHGAIMPPWKAAERERDWSRLSSYESVKVLMSRYKLLLCVHTP